MFMSLMSRDKAFYRSFGLLIFGLMLEQVAVLSVNLIDNVMIGNYSETSLAAITAINQIQFIFQTVQIGRGIETAAEMQHFAVQLHRLRQRT